jgi:hypothetical protein
VVTIEGDNFEQIDEVLFNDAAAEFSVEPPTLILATVPDDATIGPITVRAATGDAVSAISFVPQQPLTVTRTGPGSGAVAAEPTGIDCPDLCAALYPIGTVVTLTATAGPDSEFAGWSGACSGTEPVCEATVDAAKTAIASFALKRFAVTVTVVGSGRVTSDPAGIDCPGDCSQTYVIDTEVTLTAQPEASARFVGWSGACSGSEAGCALTVNDAQATTATFETVQPASQEAVRLPLLRR